MVGMFCMFDMIDECLYGVVVGGCKVRSSNDWSITDLTSACYLRPYLSDQRRGVLRAYTKYIYASKN